MKKLPSSSSWLRSGLFGLTLMLLYGCTDEPDSLRRELQTNRELWDSHSILDYSYEFKRSCFCQGEITAPVIIHVQNMSIIAVSEVSKDESVDAARWVYYLTVEELFDEIDAALDKDVYEIVVDYDSELGYPSSINIDFDKSTIDEEVGFLVELIDFNETG